MGYYTKDENDQIYADIAFRLGKIVIQYEQFDIEEKYEATLYVAVLQSLLTINYEYGKSKYFEKMITAMDGQPKYFKKSFESSQDFESVEWGLGKGCWVENTFKETINLKNFIHKMRNSVSHPTKIDYYSSYPSTGYTALDLDDDKTIIKKYGFVNSPDVRDNRLRYYSESEIKNLLYRKGQNGEEVRRRDNQIPKEVTYSYDKSELKYFFTRNSERFIRISKIELSVEELGAFVKQLANYLAQPITNNWDGIEIIPLLELVVK